MITIVFLGADPPTNFWVRAEFTSALPRLRDTCTYTIETERYISPISFRPDLCRPRYKNVAAFANGKRDRRVPPAKTPVSQSKTMMYTVYVYV